jgi:hypothetical protein
VNIMDGSIERIETAINEELDRQARSDAHRIDIHAMASRIDDLLRDGTSSPTPRAEMRGAKRPDQLNATNDG